MTKARLGPGRPAGVDSAETRQRVVEAACRCFVQYGYGPATNTLIAEMAGVTAGSVYYHFGTKGKLFEVVCDDVYGQIVQRSEQAMAGAHTVASLLRAVLEEAARINHESPHLAGFVASAPVDARRHPELAEAFGKQAIRMNEAAVQAVTVGQAAGLIPAEFDPVQVAVMINTVVGGFAEAAAGIDPDALDTTIGLFGDMLLPVAD